MPIGTLARPLADAAKASSQRGRRLSPQPEVRSHASRYFDLPPLYPRTNVGELSPYGAGPLAQDGWQIAPLPNDSNHGNDIGIQRLVDQIVFPYRVDVQRGIAQELVASRELVTTFYNVLSAFVQVFKIAAGE